MNTFDPVKLKETMRRIEGNIRSARDLTLMNPFCERFTRECLDDVYLIQRDCDELIAKRKEEFAKEVSRPIHNWRFREVNEFSEQGFANVYISK